MDIDTKLVNNTYSYIKKIIAVILTIIIVMLLITRINAITFSVGSGSIAYAGPAFYDHTNLVCSLNSVGFIGFPPGVFPYGKSIYVSMYSSPNGIPVSNTAVFNSLSIKQISINTTGNYYVGVSTNAVGCTVALSLY